MSKKPKEVYREYYTAGAVVVDRELLPERFPYMQEGFVVESMEIRAAAVLDDGREYQDIRVFTRETGGAR